MAKRKQVIEYVSVSHKARKDHLVKRSNWDNDTVRKGYLAEGYFLTNPEQVKDNLELVPLTENSEQEKVDSNNE
jgi:hypothetical protein